MFYGAVIDPKLKEACGVCGGFSRGDDLPYLTCFALYALQHRGQESAGIAVGGGGEKNIWLKRGMGLVSEVFPSTDLLKERRGSLTVGHMRYSYGAEGWHRRTAAPFIKIPLRRARHSP